MLFDILPNFIFARCEKWDVIVSNKNSIYVLPHKLPEDGNSHNFMVTSANSSSKNEHFVNASIILPKKEIEVFP